MSVRIRRFLPLLLILLVGAALRLHAVGVAPPGLYRDEAFYGLDGAGVLNGELAIWFPANNGREALFIYLLSASIAGLGHSVFALRITAAFVGIAAIAAVFAAGNAMFGRRVGVLAAAIMATTFWATAISRVAYRAGTLPLVASLAVALLFLALRAHGRRRTALAFACGAAFGLTFYTYASGQFLAPLFALAAIFLVVRRRGLVRDRGAIAALAAAALVLAPFLIWLVGHADLYFARAGQVSILNPAINGGDPLGALQRGVGRVLGMFVFEGDRIWRHNESLRPVFTGFLAPAFVVGPCVLIVRTVQHRRTARSADALAAPFALAWLLLFLVPSALAEDAPHFLRAIGALPAACVVCAVGLEAALAWASRRGLLLGLARGPLYRRVSPPALVAAAAIAFSGWQTARDYFDVYVKRDVVAYWLEAQNVALARTANDAPGDVFVDQRLASDNAALDFLAARSFTRLDPLTPPASFAASPTFTALLDPNHPWDAARAQLPMNARIAVREGPLAQGDLDPQPRRSFIAIDVGARQTGESIARFEGGIHLLAAHVVTTTAPARMQVELLWSADAAVDSDYAVFVHLIANDGTLIAQHDSSPASGYLPMPTWRAGQQIGDVHILDLTTGAGRTPDYVAVGIYRREDGRRLVLTDADGTKRDYAIIPLR
jgi:4-amino-4-deoxy-L-arabinose transferase-like glycosyltransferase